MAALEGPVFEPGSMELFGSRPSDPLSTSLGEIDSCHVFVAILSDRYGSIAPGQTKSYSQLEYEHAVELGRPILAYVYGANNPEAKQAEFIARVKTTQTVRPPISDPDHLAKCVVADLQFLVSDTFVKYITRADLPARSPTRIPLFLPQVPEVSRQAIREEQRLPQPDYSKFVGREPEQKKIQEVLNPADRRYLVAINGIGGVGKTSLALQSAHKSNADKEFERYVWVSAKKSRLTSEGVREMTPGLSSLDDLLVHIAVGDETAELAIDSPGELYSSAINSLKKRRTLLIVDNLETVDDAEEIGIFLTKVPAPSKVLVTTREQIPEGSVEIRLREFGITATREFLKNEAVAPNGRVGLRLSDTDVETIHDATGGIPLALRWVLGLLSQENAKLEEVLRTLSGRDSEPLRFCFSNVREKLPADARKVLLAFAQFTPEGTEQLASELSNVVGKSFDRAMDQLRQFSLLNRDDLSQAFSLLPLTREFVESDVAPQVTDDIAEYKRRAIDLCVARGVMKPLAVLVEELAKKVDERETRPEIQRLEARAGGLFAASRFKEAGEVAKGISESDPKSLVAARIRARSLEELQDYVNAVQAYDVLCSLESGNPHNWIHLSIVQRECGRLGESLMSIQRAIVLDPMNVIGNHSLAMLFVRMNRVQDARNQFQRTLDIDPANKPTIQAWAMLESHQSNNKTAEKLFRSAFIRSPHTIRDRQHNAKVADAFARHLERLGHYDEALMQVDIGLTYDPGNKVLRRLKDRLRRRTRSAS